MEVLYNTNLLDMADFGKPHFTFILNPDSSIAQVKTPKANITTVPKNLKVDENIDEIKKFFEEEVKKLEEQKIAKEATVEAAKAARAAVEPEPVTDDTIGLNAMGIRNEGGKKTRKTQKKRRTRRNRKNKRKTSKK